MTIKIVKIDGITVRYQELANEGKEAIVFLHYGGATLATWNAMIPFFKENYHIIAPDLRGHGLSDKEADSYHLDDMAKDVVGLLDKLKVEKVYVVGSSLGADVALSIGAHYPERVHCLVLDGGYYDIVGPDSKEQTITEEAIKARMEDLKGKILSQEQKFFDSMDEAIAFYEESWKKNLPWTDAVRISIKDDLCETKEGKITSNQTRKVVWSFIEPLYEVRFIDYYEKINCPLLFLPDEEEMKHEIVQRNLKKYGEMVPYSKVVTIEGSIHAYTGLIKPKEMSEEVLTFIEEVKGL